MVAQTVVVSWRSREHRVRTLKRHTRYLAPLRSEYVVAKTSCDHLSS